MENIKDIELQSSKVKIENRKSFLERISDLPEDAVQSIDFAYDLSKESHRPQIRETGERYFEHPRNVALILIDECKIKDPEIIIAALLHDSVEDSGLFGNRGMLFSEWTRTAKFRLGKIFGEKTAELIIALTKPKPDGEEIINKEQAYRLYLKNLSAAGSKAILIKMSDRLHNLRTLRGTSLQKQRKIVNETKSIYFPLFKSALKEYPSQVGYMLEEMKKIINQLEENFKK